MVSYEYEKYYRFLVIVIMYKEFILEQEVEDWFEKDYKEFLRDINFNANNNNTLGGALYNYSGSMHSRYNELLRLAHGSIKKLEEIVNHNPNYIESYQDINLIYKAIQKNKTNENIVVYRFKDESIFKYLRIVITKRKIIVEKNFMSTTLLPFSKTMEKFNLNSKYKILKKINIPEGTNCVPIRFNTKLSLLKEYEILLPPNIKTKLKTLKIKRLLPLLILAELDITD